MHEVHKAKNKAFSFCPSDDIWVLDVHTPDAINMAWLHNAEQEPDMKQAVLRIFVDCAKKLAPISVSNSVSQIRSLSTQGNLNAIEQLWPRISNSSQIRVKMFFQRGSRMGITEFDELVSFIKDAGVKSNKSAPLDIRKGMYSSVEEDSLVYALRTVTERGLASISRVKGVATPTAVGLGLLLAYHLMRGLLRRPVQLAALKWDDVRPSGIAFSQDITSPLLAEDGIFHLRTFKGKTGDFRGYAEERSHRLESELSNLIAIYHKHYWKTFTANLTKLGIKLSDDELRDISKRAPIFPQLKWFTEQFEDKPMVFKSVSMKSKAFHSSGTILTEKLRDYAIANFSPHLQSDRIPADEHSLRPTTAISWSRQSADLSSTRLIKRVSLYCEGLEK